MSSLTYLLVFLVCLAVTESVRMSGEPWTNSWAVRVGKDVSEKDVDNLAKKYGFKNLKQIGNLRHVYNFVLKDGGSREHLEKTLQLRKDDKVIYAKQEKSKTMVPKNKHHRFIF